MQVSPSSIPQPIRDVTRLFDANGFKVRPVGGCVRDLVRSKSPKDWDCATDAPPAETFRILDEAGYKPFDISNGHGTVSFIADDETYEITTLRLDVETDGRFAKVEFISDFEADAARRDFTFNAMSCDPLTGEVFDYFGGIEDLENQKVRFVGDANKRLQEDYLRILRWIRFIGRMEAWTVDDDAFIAVRANVAGLSKVSGERIWMEVKQIMSDPNHETLFQLMLVTGVAKQIGMR